MHNWNLLVSCKWNAFGRARNEIRAFLAKQGDNSPVIERTLARGIIGVTTSLDSREVVHSARKAFKADPKTFTFAIKWVPVDSWIEADMPAMEAQVKKIAGQISPNEKWRTLVEKRRFTKYHSEEIIKALEVHIASKSIDIHSPDKILRVDILGDQAGITILKPEDIFSTAKP